MALVWCCVMVASELLLLLLLLWWWWWWWSVGVSAFVGVFVGVGVRLLMCVGGGGGSPGSLSRTHVTHSPMQPASHQGAGSYPSAKP